MGIRKILAKVGSYFSKKPKPRPFPSGHAQGSGFRYGHRGVAAGSVAKPDLSDANKAKWRMLGEASARGFMDGEPLFVHSTNVVMVQFFPDANKLMIEFKNGHVYMYDDISSDMAYDFLHVASKGNWVWRKLRGLGSSTGSLKPYRRVK